jgi:hypothetical protein
VFHLHSIFPLLIGLGLDKEGAIKWEITGF